MPLAYLRFPAIHRDRLVLCAEGDLWVAPSDGGTAQRLTNGTGQVAHPRISPDGTRIAFTSDEDGQAAVYVQDLRGGAPRRLTYEGGLTLTSGWHPDGARIVFATSARGPHPGQCEIFTVAADGGLPERLAVGPALLASLAPDGRRIVLNRHSVDPARWKRYRGGKAGELWIGEVQGGGKFRKLVELPGNCAHPFWCAGRVFFVSDHEGFGNLYSVEAEGGDLRRHTWHHDFYVRWPSGHDEGGRAVVVYQCGAEIYRIDAPLEASATARKISLDVPGVRRELRRKLVGPSDYLEEVAIHPEGHSLLLTVRGQLAVMPHWQGAAQPLHPAAGVRHRLARFLPDGQRALCVADRDGEEGIEILPLEAGAKPERRSGAGMGRVEAWAVSPDGTRVALVDHRRQTYLYDLRESKLTRIDGTMHMAFGHVPGDFAWSPDSRWLCYSQVGPEGIPYLRLCDTRDGSTTSVTAAEHDDFHPSFDPEGRYLYFLSRRVLDPVLDTRQLDASFPNPVRPYVIPLRRGVLAPLDRWDPEPPMLPDLVSAVAKPHKAEAPAAVTIDLEDLGGRARPIPVAPGNYLRLHAEADRLWLLNAPHVGLLQAPDFVHPSVPTDRTLLYYSLKDRETKVRQRNVTDFEVAGGGQTLALRVGARVRVLPLVEGPGGRDDKEEGSDKPSRKTGWVDMSRLEVPIEPAREWRQIFLEAWRMQRDFFWTEDLSHVDWDGVRARYLPLLDRVATRHELSDLIWEVLGELGTSHAYEMGGDLESGRKLPVGHLAAELRFRPDRDAYEILSFVRGDAWLDGASSPLQTPGLEVTPGQLLLAVDGQRLSRTVPPGELLVNKAGKPVALTLAAADGSSPRTVVVRALPSEHPARHRAWVDENRRRVAAATDGRVGYLHIPDMGAEGLVEFHRGWWAQWMLPGLVVDARWNRGGFVGQILLEKLSRQIVGYVKPRWGQPEPFPSQALRGPIVVLCNENTGSDGDIFCQTVRNLKLGPLVGKRTWGGVVGIEPVRRFVDGGLTTQPEYAFWFYGPRWDVENTGVVPDIEVEYPPEAWAKGEDPQLGRAIQIALDLLAQRPSALPDFGPAPDRRPPDPGGRTRP